MAHKNDAVVIGRPATGSVNDFHRCPQCRMGSSYPVPLYDGTPIKCPHCEYTRPHNCHPDRPEQPTWKCNVCLNFPHKNIAHPMYGTHEALEGF